MAAFVLTETTSLPSKRRKRTKKRSGLRLAEKKKKRVTFFSPFGTSPQTACHVPQLLRPLARENQKRRQKQNDLSFEGIKKKKKRGGKKKICSLQKAICSFLFLILVSFFFFFFVFDGTENNKNNTREKRSKGAKKKRGKKTKVKRMQASHLQKANQHISGAAQLHDFSPRMQLCMCVSICLRCRVTKLPSMLFFYCSFSFLLKSTASS